jgi:hypothetical protein
MHLNIITDSSIGENTGLLSNLYEMYYEKVGPAKQKAFNRGGFRLGEFCEDLSNPVRVHEVLAISQRIV